jgi:DNA polymerase III delta subunit
MLYLWYGSNEYAREEQIHALEKKTGLVRVSFSASNPPASAETLLAQDLFSGGQIIVLEDLMSTYLVASWRVEIMEYALLAVLT